MCLCWSFHVSGYETHNIGKVRSCSKKIHQAAYHLLEVSSIHPFSTIIFREPVTRNNKVADHITLFHTKPGEYFFSIFLLNNEDSSSVLSYFHTKKYLIFPKSIMAKFFFIEPLKLSINTSQFLVYIRSSTYKLTIKILFSAYFTNRVCS